MNTLEVALSPHLTYLRLLNTLDSEPWAYFRKEGLNDSKIVMCCKGDLLLKSYLLIFDRGLTFQFIQYLDADCVHTQVIIRNSVKSVR